MIVCFRCTAETKAHLDSLLATGAYQTYDEAIAAAVRNQVVMEQEVTEKGAIVIAGPAVAPPPAPGATTNGQPEVRPTAKRTANGAPPKEVPAAAHRAAPAA